MIFRSARLSRRESDSKPETNKQSNENLAQQEKNVIQHMMKDKVIEDMMKEVARSVMFKDKKYSFIVFD